MRYVKIGDKDVSVVGLGAWQFGTPGWGWGEEFARKDVEAIIDRSLAGGVNLIDTAERYGDGLSEKLLGELLGQRREDVFLASKIAPYNVRSPGIKRSVEESLKRLKTDWIDLYQIHWFTDEAESPRAVGEMRSLLDSGVIKHMGVSNYTIGQWKRLEQKLGYPVLVNQVLYNLLEREPELELMPYGSQNNRFIMAYSPIAQGVLSGKYAPGNAPGGIRAGHRWFTGQNIQRLRPLLRELQDIAANHSAGPAQIALAWLLHRSNIIVIPGAKSVEQATENAAAADIELSQGELERLDATSRAF